MPKQDPRAGAKNMNILELSERARNFYENTRSRNLYSGYDKNVLTREDFESCLFVDSNYKPQPGDYLFRLATINGQTKIDLKEHVPAMYLPAIALKGKFNATEWETILRTINGISINLQEPGPGIAEEIEDPELSEKIRSLSRTETALLYSVILEFWYNKSGDPIKFIQRFI